jgi:polyisoprenoid-binding protein YceI
MSLLRLAPALALILAGLSVPTPASADTWVIDGAHSHVGFKVRHMAVSWVRGSFDTVEGSVDFDGKNLKKASTNVTIDIASVDTKNEKRDEHLASADFFDAATHPNMTFTSTKVKAGKDDSFEIVGDLTMKGVTKSVTLAVEGGLTPVTDPWGNTKLGFSASTVIDRKDFGLTWNKVLDGGGVVVGDDVHLVLEVELNKKQD